MVISVFEGSAIAEDGVEERVKKVLRNLIQRDDQITFYFFVDSPFSWSCEWAVRELCAAYPNKKLDSVVILWDNQERVFPAVRFSAVKRKGPADCDARDGWFWMIDHTDYVCCYMHPKLCTSRRILAAYQYAEKKLGSRCINFASPEAWEEICQAVPTLVHWERAAFEGRIQGKQKAVLAQELSVHRSTLREYEISACYHLVKKVYTKKPSDRKCAVLDFSSRALPEWKSKYLLETLRYLVRYVSVNEFIVPAVVESNYTQLMDILWRVKRETPLQVQIKAMEPQGELTEAWKYSNDNRTSYVYSTPSNRYVSRLYEERKAMIDLADIVLCCPRNSYRSGLSYAAKKRIPIINLALYGPEDRLED